MEAITQTKTQEIVNHHLSGFSEADVNEIMKDFTEESESDRLTGRTSS